jgi:hypothetical protein
MAEWTFRRRQGWCAACERRFEEGERHASTLAIRGEQILREDVCAACFRADSPGSRPRESDVFWWMTRQRADKKRTLALDLEALERLFERLEPEGASAARELRFVLCLLLMRKRRLKLERVVRGGKDEGEAMLVRKPRRRETTRVQVFDFAPERLEELRRELEEAFEEVEPEPEGGGGAPAAEDGAPEGDEGSDGLGAEDEEPSARLEPSGR